jgi:hypothetical protein
VLDTGESSNFSNFWIPAFAGMTILKLFSPIATQSRMPDYDWRGLAEVINLTVALILLGKHFPKRLDCAYFAGNR